MKKQAIDTVSNTLFVPIKRDAPSQTETVADAHKNPPEHDHIPTAVSCWWRWRRVRFVRLVISQHKCIWLCVRMLQHAEWIKQRNASSHLFTENVCAVVSAKSDRSGLLSRLRWWVYQGRDGAQTLSTKPEKSAGLQFTSRFNGTWAKGGLSMPARR